MDAVRRFLDRLQSYGQIVNIAEIARRYFAMNAFDGVLTIIGVLMGNFTAGVEDPRIVVTTGLATCVAMGISGLWGAYLTEAAERQRELLELEQDILTDLQDTTLGKASRAAVVIVALVDGLSPFLAALVVLTPFFVPQLFPSLRWTYITAIALALITLFSLGAFLGHISRRNIAIYGFRTVIAGGISIVISLLLGGAH
ncbi:MAG: VIT1/CCC1 transporter family protein [Anaerolineaceae bacterium]|nr:MAG: VIT1/CCC1 transporter family protein [Anaerolineaceae bacterium]